jgi:hypothetical protein
MANTIEDVVGSTTYNSARVIEAEGVPIGSTKYLDSFDDDIFNNGHIIRGVDRLGRPFLSFRVELSNNDENKRYIYTAFQRYTDNHNWYVLCKSHFSESKDYEFEKLFKSGSATINKEGFETLKKIFKNYADGNEGEEYEFVGFDETKKYLVKLYN